MLYFASNAQFEQHLVFLKGLLAYWVYQAELEAFTLFSNNIEYISSTATTTPNSNFYKLFYLMSSEFP